MKSPLESKPTTKKTTEEVFEIQEPARLEEEPVPPAPPTPRLQRLEKTPDGRLEAIKNAMKAAEQAHLAEQIQTTEESIELPESEITTAAVVEEEVDGPSAQEVIEEMKQLAAELGSPAEEVTSAAEVTEASSDDAPADEVGANEDQFNEGAPDDGDDFDYETPARRRSRRDDPPKVSVFKDFVPNTEIEAIDDITASLEAIIFISDKPLSLERLNEVFTDIYSQELILQGLHALTERFKAQHHGLELTEVAGGFLFRTKASRASLAKKLTKVQTQKLSPGAMETLAVVAYKQPVMKEDIDKVRGVDSSHFIRILLDRKLVKITGRSDLPGRPMLYSTSGEFLHTFGLKDLESLPPLREIEQMIPASETRPPEEELKRVVSQMNTEFSDQLDYDPREDEALLQDIRERISQVNTTTPYLEEQKQIEKLQAEKDLDPQVQASLDKLLGPGF